MALCLCDGAGVDAAACGWSQIKEGHWELGGGYRQTVLRARASVHQSSAGQRIEQLVCMLSCSPEALQDPAHAVRAYMKLSGGCEKLERCMRIMFADCWAYREAQVERATFQVTYRARKLWKQMNLPSEDYARWMQALTKAALFYYAAGVEPRGGSAFEARGCVFSI